MTDLGTEFDVEVTKERQSQLPVFQGKVVVRVRESAISGNTVRPEVQLMAGEAACIEPNGEVKCYRGPQAKAVANATSFIPTFSIPRSLIAYWPMDYEGDMVAYDRARNRIDAVLIGGANWTKGRFGSGIRFHGTNNDQRAQTVAALPALGTGDFTVSLWFQGAPSGDTYRWLFAIGGQSDPDTLFIQTAGGYVNASLGGWYHEVSATGPLSGLIPLTDSGVGAWYHIALVRGGGAVTTYVNGVQDGPIVKNAYTSSNIASHPVSLGGFVGDGGSLVGTMDDVAVWNQALTPLQIKALADGSATPLNVLPLDRSRPDKNDKAGASGDDGKRKTIAKGGGP